MQNEAINLLSGCQKAYARCREMFLEQGYFAIDAEIDPDTINECREIVCEDLRRLRNVNVSDSRTWPEEERVSLDISYGEKTHPSFMPFLASVHLEMALDIVLGDDIEAAEFGIGWWVVNFPSQALNSRWSPRGRRHIDGSHFAHTATLQEIGLKLLYLLNDVETNCGGTVLYSGSHKLVSQTLASFSFIDGFSGVKNSNLVNEMLRRYPSACDQPVQATGKAGTIYVVHPHLVHSRSANSSPKGSRGIRYLALPSVSLVSPLHWDIGGEEANEDDSSALRLSLRRAYCRASARRKRNAKRRRTF